MSVKKAYDWFTPPALAVKIRATRIPLLCSRHTNASDDTPMAPTPPLSLPIEGFQGPFHTKEYRYSACYTSSATGFSLLLPPCSLLLPPPAVPTWLPLVY